MLFQKSLIQCAIVGGMAISTSAFAVDGTIDFQGQITDTTCAVAVNSGTNNGTVTLPTIAASALPAVASTAGATPFTISLTGCTGTALNTASTLFENGANVDAAAGRLNSTGTASGVQIELLNAAQAPLHVGAAGLQGDTPADISSGSATMNYFARYYASGASVTPGSVVSRVDYTIQYQ